MIGFQNFRGIPPPPHHYIYARILLSSNESLKIGKWENLLAAFGEKKFKSGKRKNPGAQGPIFVSWASSGTKKRETEKQLPFSFCPPNAPHFFALTY
jgi:hypothetical protein